MRYRRRRSVVLLLLVAQVAVCLSVTAASADDDAEIPVSPESIIEAILFVGHPGNEPVSSRSIASLMRGVRAAEVESMIQQLNEAGRWSIKSSSSASDRSLPHCATGLELPSRP